MININNNNNINVNNNINILINIICALSTYWTRIELITSSKIDKYIMIAWS